MTQLGFRSALQVSYDPWTSLHFIWQMAGIQESQGKQVMPLEFSILHSHKSSYTTIHWQVAGPSST